MSHLSIDPASLEAAVNERRDVRYAYTAPADRRWVATAFRHGRVLLSRSRIKAEAFLWQN